MKALTRLQVLEKQNRDLKARLENREGKSEIALIAAEDELKTAREQLRAANATIAMLQKEIGNLTRELEIAVDLRDGAMLARIEAAAGRATAPLIAELAQAHLEIARLKAIVNKDSSNSSKPSSKNGFRQIPNCREKSGKPRGGQKGHPGHRLGLPENIDELVAGGIVKKRVIDHSGGSAEYVSRYVVDVEVLTTITEHRYAIGAQFPESQYNEVSYGDNIKAMSVMLLTEGIIAEQRFSDILAGITQGVVTISPATLERFKSQFAGKLEGSGELDAIREDLLNGEVINTDDTPLRCAETVEYLEDGTEVVICAEGKSYSATVRTHSSETATFYTVNPRKDMEGIKRDGLLPGFFGILGHDHEIKFYNYGMLHSTCGEHLRRELIGLRDLQMISWAEDMRSHIVRMNAHKNKDLAEGKTACAPVTLAAFEQTFDDLLERGRGDFGQMKKGDFGYDELRVMLNRLTDFKDCYLLFIRNYKAPWSNNLAERDLRPEKTKEKVSLLFRSWNGIKNHVKIRSFLSTAKKRGIDLFSAISNVNNGIAVLRKS
jgi:hypothetical protein